MASEAAESKKTPLAGGTPPGISQTTQAERLIVFHVKEMWLALDIQEVSEIIADFEVTPIPQVPPYVVGVSNLRGQMVPVMNLAIRFEQTSNEKTPLTRILVLKEPYERVGFLVDEVREIVRVKPDLVLDLPKFISTMTIPHHFLKGVSMFHDELLFILDVKEVLAKEDFKKQVGHPERSEGSR